VQELNVKTPSKEEKQRNCAKANSQWRAEAVSTRDHLPPTRNGEWKARYLAMASERRRGLEIKGPEFVMANNILARRVKATKTPQS